MYTMSSWRHEAYLNASPPTQQKEAVMAMTTERLEPSIRTQPIYTRPLANDADFWRVRNLLLETVPLTPLDFNWDIRRWEGKRFYAADPSQNSRLAGRVQLWLTHDERVVGAVHPEGCGDAYLQIHPDFREVEPAMITWAEAHLALPTADGVQQQLEIFVYEYDTVRQQLLQERGYTKMTYGGVVRRLRLADYTLKGTGMATGYALRTTHPDDLADCQQIADLLNAAFGRDFHNALEYQNFTKFAPSFRKDLDLVAVAPDGTFAAYVGIPYDEVNRRGIFEPVCTHPAHRRHGLAQSLMLEGLRCLHALGAVDATVGTGDMIPANRLYERIGFTEVQKGYVWQKVWAA